MSGCIRSYNGCLQQLIHVIVVILVVVVIRVILVNSEIRFKKFVRQNLIEKKI
jgi:hypothetical protein